MSLGRIAARRSPVQAIARLVIAVTMACALAPRAFAADGDLDPSFGGTGIVFTDGGNGDSESAHAVAIQSDGKIVLAGSTDPGAKSDFALARYNGDGTIDSAFGIGGWVSTTIGPGNDAISAIALQTNGDIVVAGSSGNSFAVARYLSATGALDPSFGAGGFVTASVGAVASGEAVAIGPDGKIVVAGTANNHFFVARFTVSGTIDTSFNLSGIAATSIGASDWGQGVAVQPDNKIVLAGYSDLGPSENFALVRYNISGTLDTSFNVTGKVHTDFLSNSNDQAHAVALQADGKIVVAGFTTAGGQSFGVLRYNPNGSLDTTFGALGKAYTPVGSVNQARALAIQPTGKLVVAGTTGSGGNTDFAVVRYTQNGALDTTFNSAGANPGIVVTDIDQGSEDLGLAVAVQPDNQIVVAGSCDQGGFSAVDVAVVRYDSPASPPTVASFGKVMLEDGIAGITKADFTGNFSDPDGSSMTAVTIVSLPADGVLRFNGTDITGGQVISASALVSVTFTPAANWYGSTSFDWNASDGMAGATVDATVTLTVTPVNDAPSFIKGPDQSARLGTGLQSAAGWATSILAGPPNESGQTMTFTLATSNDAVFATLPAVAWPAGDLSFEPSAHVWGSAVITVTLTDSGGTAGGGADSSPLQTFLVTIRPYQLFLPQTQRALPSFW